MKSVIIFILSMLAFTTYAQDYPKDYFGSPLNIPIYLAGNFGECRSNHFHSGLDMKTEQRENLPIYSIADGYVSRIKMQNGGFGHCLYVQHPNGYTSVYAHLNDFAPEIQAYMKNEQYRRKSWMLDLYPPSSMFRVKKGELIAYSGNTGGSTAPHLHLEIRNAKGYPVNGMLFGFDIKDNIPPKPYNVAVYDANNSIYEQEPVFKSLKKAGSKYTVDTIVVNTEKAAIGLDVFDYMNNSKNTLNFYIGELYMDSVLQCRLVIDNIPYETTRFMNAYVDYRIKKEKGRWVQLFYKLPGNDLNTIYEGLNNERGRLSLNDTEPHRINIGLIDPLGNTTDIEFYLRNNGMGGADLMCNSDDLFEQGKSKTFEHPNVRFTFGTDHLYDDICFTFNEKEDTEAYSSRYQLHKPSIPIHKNFTLYIKPNKPIPFDLRHKIALIENDGKGDYGYAAEFENGWYKKSIRYFGEYRLVADNEPPRIIPMQKREVLTTASRISFKVKENITSVDKFIGKIDGEWVPFEQNGDVFFYTFDDHCGKGDHELMITATDENGNSETITYTFTR